MKILRSLDAHIHILSQFLQFSSVKGISVIICGPSMFQFLKYKTIFHVVKPIHIFKALLEKL